MVSRFNCLIYELMEGGNTRYQQTEKKSWSVKMIILNSEHDNLMTGRDETQQSNFNTYLLTDLTASRVSNREEQR